MPRSKRAAILAATMVAIPGLAAAETVAIKGATVWIDGSTKVEDATVVIDSGRVAAAGKVAVPAGARVIDGAGKVVTAGFIDASSRLGLVEVSAVAPTREGRFADDRGGVFASYRTADGFNRRSVAIPISRTGGVTAVVSTPSGGFVAGIGGAFTLAAGVDPGIARDAALYANLGEDALGANSGSRGLALARLRELLDDAQRYSRNRAAYERNQSRELAARRLDLEALLLVKQRRLPLVVRADRASDIRAALALAREQRIRLVIEGGVEAWQLAAELAAARVPVLMDPSSNLPSSFDRVHVRDDGAARLAAAGVPLILSGLGDAANVRNLRQIAGIAVSFGMTREQALAAITSVPAEVFGLGRRGTLARGQIADLVVWSGDPFEPASAAEHVFIGGVEQSLRTRQTLLFERYKKLPKPGR
jgi:imidazolonepropionase-like amidohydrolase